MFDRKSYARQRYQQRKLSGKCTYKGCDKPQSEDCLMCEVHREMTRAIQRRHSAIRRQSRMSRPPS